MLVTPFAREMIFSVIVALCLVAQAAILRSTLRAAGIRRRRIAEVSLAAVPAAALALLLILAHGALR